MTALHTLVVDDSLTARTVLKRLLERKGAQVDQSESGAQALDYLKSKTPDVIFMDHTMPGMTGLEAIERIRRNPATSAIPVIMYTNQFGEAYSQQALGQGANGVIPKPATWQKIADALSSLSLSGQKTPTQSVCLEREINNLKTHIVDSLNQQGHLLQEQIKSDIDARLKVLAKESSVPNTMALSNLVHSVTDSKIHQLNLEWRQQMTARLDVLLQDIQDEQKILRQELLQELEQKMTQQYALIHRDRAQTAPFLDKIGAAIQENGINNLFWFTIYLSTALILAWALTS